MAEKDLCPGCQRHVVNSRWVFSLFATIIFSLVTVFWQAGANLGRQLQQHEALDWHAGAGEAHASTRARMEAMQVQIHQRTADRFRRGEWLAWKEGQDKIVTDLQRRIQILESK